MRFLVSVRSALCCILIEGISPCLEVYKQVMLVAWQTYSRFLMELFIVFTADLFIAWIYQGGCFAFWHTIQKLHGSVQHPHPQFVLSVCH
jgi:hypothetical protein